MTLAFSINSQNQVREAIIFNVATLITERKLQGSEEEKRVSECERQTSMQGKEETTRGKRKRKEGMKGLIRRDPDSNIKRSADEHEKG